MNKMVVAFRPLLRVLELMTLCVQCDAFSAWMMDVTVRLHVNAVVDRIVQFFRHSYRIVLRSLSIVLYNSRSFEADRVGEQHLFHSLSHNMWNGNTAANAFAENRRKVSFCRRKKREVVALCKRKRCDRANPVHCAVHVILVFFV